MDVTETPRSSVTALNGTSSPPSPLQRVRSSLDEEIAEDERRIEKYGGNDINEPEPKIPHPLAFLSPPQDPNMISWDGPEDQGNPQNWSQRRKWMVTFICVVMSVNVSFASSAPTSATTDMMIAFGVNAETAYAIVTVFLLGYVVGPSFWGPGSELYGRRPVLVGTMTCYTLFHLGQALAQNIETLMICRFFTGFFAVAPLTICGGVIADVWPALGRGPAVSLFSASVFMGPVLGPIVGGFIASSDVTWRWIYWVMMMFAGTCTFITAVFLPETYAPVLLANRLNRMRKESPEKVADMYAEHEQQDWTLRGMLMLEPILVLVTIYLSVVYGVLYARYSCHFRGKPRFTLWENGLVFIGVGVGTTIGAITTYLTSLHYKDLVVKWKGFPPPEQRLFGAMIGAPSLVIGAFWLGWTGQYPDIHWIVPTIATVFIGASICLIFNSFLSYLVDTYLMYAASAFASNTIIRSLVASAFPLFTVQMYHNLGINWASTLVGLIGLVLAPMPFLFYKYGPRIRSNSKFAPCIDLKIAKVLEQEAQATAQTGEKAV
ncbi:MFS polyamine transporter [Hymenopellis radicata]|nr:MFS polyamine transporter [Hymenopellis radicata]